LRCQYCQNNVDLPFRCPFCGGYFCPEHRLPENHVCPELLRVKAKMSPTTEEHRQSVAEGKPELTQRETFLRYPLRFKKPSLTSSTEMAHLALGAMIVTGVGLSFYEPVYDWIFYLFHDPIIFLSSALLFTSIFFTHELAHKAAAKHYGLWAEFRLNLTGAILTLLSIPLPLFKIISPGAVMIAGAASKKIVGITALAGPFTSIVFTALFFDLSLLVQDPSLASMLFNTAELGASVAFFNLVPLSILDGAKVFWWNKSVWAISFISSIALGLAVLAYPLF
jgi:Zn-dependent protease